jgi:hypothetical protein
MRSQPLQALDGRQAEVRSPVRQVRYGVNRLIRVDQLPSAARGSGAPVVSAQVPSLASPSGAAQSSG